MNCSESDGNPGVKEGRISFVNTNIFDFRSESRSLDGLDTRLDCFPLGANLPDWQHFDCLRRDILFFQNEEARITRCSSIQQFWIPTATGTRGMIHARGASISKKCPSVNSSGDCLVDSGSSNYLNWKGRNNSPEDFQERRPGGPSSWTNTGDIHWYEWFKPQTSGPFLDSVWQRRYWRTVIWERGILVVSVLFHFDIQFIASTPGGIKRRNGYYH